MEWSSTSENTREEIEIEFYQNEKLMDDIPIIKTSIENLSLEIEAKNYDEKFILNLQKLHAQRLLWKPRRRNAICWAFYVVNDNKPMDGKIPQVMKCHLCYKTPTLYTPRTKLRKGLISYYKTNGISTLKKHVDAEHHLLANKLDEEMNS